MRCYEWHQQDSAIDVQGGRDLLGFMVEGGVYSDIKRQVRVRYVKRKESNSMRRKQMELKTHETGSGN